MLCLKSENNISWNNIDKKYSYVAYKSNLEDLKDSSYRTFYIEEQIANKGVIETITITLDEPTNINYIDIQTVNSSVENLRLVYANGIEMYYDYKSGIMKDAIVAQIKFDLVNKNYTNTKYYMDKSKVTEDVWNKIKDYEYRYALDVTTKFEMEEVIAKVTNGKTDIYQTNISNSSEIIEKNMYTYIFGIESITIKHIEQETDSCFISEPINIGTCSEKEYIQLHVEDVLTEYAGIEYSILDGDMEISLLPVGKELIKNERLFATLPLRYKKDNTELFAIKKDGLTTDISIDDAKLQVLSRFSIDYYPEFNYNYTPINSNIRIKAIIRKFTKDIDTSYIRHLKIRKYGGDTPWTDM